MKRDYNTSYPTSSKSAEGKPTNGKPTERSIQEELKEALTECFMLSTAVAKQHNMITEANNQITRLKDIVSSLRERNRSLQYQLDSYATYSDDSRARISVIQYRQMLGEERNNKNYFIHRLKKEIEKTTQLAQAVTNLKRRNKSLLGNFKALNNVNHDDLKLAVGLYAELIKQVSIIMDRNKPDTTMDYKNTLDDVVNIINQHASIINEIYTVIQNSKTERS